MDKLIRPEETGANGRITFLYGNGSQGKATFVYHERTGSNESACFILFHEVNLLLELFPVLPNIVIVYSGYVCPFGKG